jgi:hypothetical protein
MMLAIDQGEGRFVIWKNPWKCLVRRVQNMLENHPYAIPDGQLSVEERKLLLEREKFTHEQQRHLRDDSSLLKRGTLVVTIAGAILAAVISIFQFYLQRDRAETERQLQIEKNDREWKLRAVELVMNNDKKLFSSEAAERAVAISILKTALPVEMYNSVLGLAAQQSKPGEAREQLRGAQDIQLSQANLVENTTNPAVKSNGVIVDAANTNSVDNDIAFAVDAKKVSASGYKFTIGLKPSLNNVNNILKVDYKIDHPTFRNKVYLSVDRNSNFAMSYTGWGAVDEINATVTFKDKTTRVFNINMIRILGW